MTIRDLQVNMKYLIIFLIMDYNVLTKTCYKVQISLKITNLDGYSNFQDLQSLNLFESEYVLQWLYWDTGEYFSFFTTLFKFWQSFLNDSVMVHYCLIALSMLVAFPFYSATVGFRGTTKFSLLLL